MKQPEVLKFIGLESDEDSCSEDEFFIRLSIKWSENQSQVASKSKKTSSDAANIEELFGPNVLDNVQKKSYPITLKLKIETFLLLVNEINSKRIKVLQKLENLVLLIIEWLGKFQQLNDLDDIEKWLFIWNYQHDDKNKIYKDYLNIKCLRGQLSDMLNVFGLPPFAEPNGKSLDKIDSLYSLLKETEEQQWKECNEIIEKRLKHANDMFYRIEGDFEIGLESIEFDINLMYRVDDYELRIVRLREILNDLREFNELINEMNKIKDEIKSICVPLNRGFDHLRYTTPIETFKMKVGFLRDLSISGLETIKNQIIEKRDVIKLFKISQKANNGGDEKIHKLIKESFDLQEVDAIHLIFKKYDTGSKGYLTKSEFLLAFGFIYPTMTEDSISEVFDVICADKGRRQVTFQEFSKFTDRETSQQSIEMSPMVQSNGTFGPDSPTSSNSDAQNSNEELVTLSSQFHLKSFEELANGKDHLTSEDLDRIQLNDKLRFSLEDIFPSSENKEFNFQTWFEEPTATEIYGDIKTQHLEGKETFDASLKDILYDLERVDIDSLT